MVNFLEGKGKKIYIVSTDDSGAGTVKVYIEAVRHSRNSSLARVKTCISIVHVSLDVLLGTIKLKKTRGIGPDASC